MSAAPGPSRPSSTTPLLASPRPGPSKLRDLSAVRYHSLPSLDRLPAKRRRTPHVQFMPFILAATVFVFVLFIAWDVSTYGNCYFKPLCRILGDGSESLREVWWLNSGPYATWKAVGPGGGRTGLPRGCEIDQVNVLHRHTARYPTTDGGERILKSLDKLRKREVHVPRKHPELAFLPHADYALDGWDFDALMDQGRKAAWKSGLNYKVRYAKLLDSGPGVFTRSAGGERVVETAQYWLEGLSGNRFRLRPSDQLREPNVVIGEGDDMNNTLAVHNCPAFESASPQPGSHESAEILRLLQPTAHRLNRLLRPQPPLEVQDLANLAELCAYDSQAHGTEFLSWSEWCHIFDRDEWDILGYAKEVARWYQVGQGSKYGATMGTGWIRELLARLTESAPSGGPTINSTLDDDVYTFPRGGRRLFVDFTHDNEMIEILAAMKVLTQHAPLPTDKVQDKRSFILSEIIPFGAQIVVERIACELGDWEPDPNPERGRKDGKKDYVRILVNDKIHRVDHIDCKQSGLMEHGLCEVELFVSSQSFATDEADWGICRRKGDGSE